jgi:hypothetical protein
MERCSHDLFARLARNPAGAEKRFAIVRRNGSPVAVVALRRRLAYWEPVTEGAVPWCLFPALPGEHAAVLRALNLRIQFIRDVHPRHLVPDEIYPYAIYRADLTQDYERHWRDAGHHKTVRQARNKTQGMQARIDHPGDIEWVTKTWMNSWDDSAEGETTAGPDRILGGIELTRAAQFHVVTLVDQQDRPVAGCTFYVHEDSVVAQVLARDESLQASAVGTRLIDETFKWAAAAGFRYMDMGGGHEYKARWAPEAGNRYLVVFRWGPLPVRRARTLAGRVRRRLKRALASLRG